MDMWRNAIEGFTIGLLMLAIAGAVIWLIKTLIDHRRWSRLSKIQTEVHNKVLDRCSRTKTCWPTSRRRPGGGSSSRRRFRVESPRADRRAARPDPVVGAGGSRAHRARPRHHLVSQNSLEEVAAAARPPWAPSSSPSAIGFLVSAVLAYVLTRRFGLMNGPNAPPESVADATFLDVRAAPWRRRRRRT